MSMKNSNDTIGNRTRDLPTCSAVPQPTAPPHSPSMHYIQKELFTVEPNVRYEVAQLVETLRYKPEGCGFYGLNPSDFTMALGSTQPPKEMSNRSYSWGSGGKTCRCVGLTTLPSSYADCLEILGASKSNSHRGLSRLVMGLPYLSRTSCNVCI
jgi:hypothetical protein